MTQVRRGVLLAAVLVAAGCSDDPTDLAADPDLATLPPPITAVQPVVETEVPTSEAPAPPATDAPPVETSAAPATDSAVTGSEPEPDWAEIVHGLLVTQFELQSDPDLDRITELCSDPSPCLNTSDIAGLVNNGQRLVGGAVPARPDSAVLIDTSEDLPWNEATFSIVRVTRTIQEVPADAAIVDADGEVIFNVTLSAGDEPGQSFDANWTITNATGEWRLFEINGA